MMAQQQIEEKEIIVSDQMQVIDYNQNCQEVEKQVPSQFFQQYSTILSNELVKEDFLVTLINKLAQSGISFSQRKFYQNISIQILKHYQGQRVINLLVKMSWFTLNITLYNQLGQSPSHKFRCLMSQQQRVYLAEIGQKTQIIKCFSIDFDQKPFKKFVKILREYCLLKIADSIKVGPTLTHSFGFDLVIYDDCVQFIMEKCTQIQNCLDLYDGNAGNELKRGLSSLHRLNIVHSDIKPPNILYSLSKQKFVFIDFGFSQIVKQSIGFKSKSMFRGTFKYCYPEMQKLNSHAITEQKFVDLYFNDAFGLKEVLSQFQLNSKFQSRYSFTNHYMSQASNSLTNYYNLLKIKGLIYLKEFSRLKNEEYKKSILQNYSQISHFLKVFLYSPELQQFTHYLKHISLENLYYFQKLNEELSFNLQKKLQNQMFKGPKKNIKKSKDSKVFSERMNVKNIGYLKTINLNEILKKKFVLDKQSIKKVKKSVYFYRFIQFIDLRTSQQSIKQKQEAIDLLMKFEKLVIGQKNTKNSVIIVKYRCVLKYLLNRYIQFKFDDFQEVIPVIMTNLILFQSYQNQYILELTVRVLSMKVNQIQYLNLLISMFTLYFWMLNINFKNKDEYLMKFMQIMKRKIEISYQDMGFIHISNQKTYLQIIKQLKKKYQSIMVQRNFSEQAKINLLSYIIGEKIIQAERQCSINYISNNYAFLIILRDLGMDLITDTTKLRSLQITFFSKFTTIKNFQIVELIYHNLRNCIQIEEIIKRFTIYYQYKRIHLKQMATSGNIEQSIHQIRSLGLQYEQYIIQLFDDFIIQLSLTNNQQLINQIKQKMKKFFNLQYLMNIPSQQFAISPQYWATNLRNIAYLFKRLDYQYKTYQIHILLQIIQFFEQLLSPYVGKNIEATQILYQFQYTKYYLSAQKSQLYIKTVYKRIIQLQKGMITPQIYETLQRFVFLLNEVIKKQQQQNQPKINNFLKNQILHFIIERILKYQLFDHFCGNQTMLFHMLKSQLVQLKNIGFFIKIQIQFMKWISTYPQQHVISIYTNSLDYFQKNYSFFMKKANRQFSSSLLSSFKKAKNPYNSLIAAYLLHLFDISSVQSRKFIKIIYENLNSVTQFAANLILNKLLVYILIINGYQNKRKQRLKFFKNFKYLLAKYQFKEFLRLTHLKNRFQNTFETVFQGTLKKKLFKYSNPQILNMEK